MHPQPILVDRGGHDSLTTNSRHQASPDRSMALAKASLHDATLVAKDVDLSAGIAMSQPPLSTMVPVMKGPSPPANITRTHAQSLLPKAPARTCLGLISGPPERERKPKVEVTSC